MRGRWTEAAADLWNKDVEENRELTYNYCIANVANVEK